MRGLLSRRPLPSAARLVLGSELLLIVTIVLLLGSARSIDGTLVAIGASVVLVALASILLALVGERVIKDRRHER